MTTQLTPLQAAKIANAVYTLKDNNDLEDVSKKSGGLGVRNLFEVDHASRFEGTSGPLVFKKSTGFGFVAPGMNTRKNETLIAVRGTASVRDALTDMNAGLQQGPSGYMVHAGFNDSFKSFKTDVDTYLNKNGANGTIHCIGHSLGGALATLMADHLISKGVANVKLYTFGCPRVGVNAFSRNLTRRLRKENIYRVYHEADPVSMVPIFPFLHVPDNDPSYLLPWNGVSISPYAHKMDNYANSIGQVGWQGLQKPAATSNMSDDIEGFLMSPAAGPALNSARVLWMIGKALQWILKKAGMGFGLAIAGGLTVVDKVAWLLTEAAHKSIELGTYVSSLVKSIFHFLGRKCEAASNISIAFLRWVLSLLFSSIAVSVSTAIAATNSFM